MADRIKGITVQIGGDTTGLSKALSSTNREISNTQSQLKDVERLLRLDPTNTELLRQKQRLLSGAVEETKEKLKTLKSASEKVAGTIKNYDAWKAAYDPIQTEIEKVEKSLKKLKTEQEKVADSKGIDSEQYKKLQTEIDTTQKKLKGLKEQAKSVSEEFGHPVSQQQYDGLQREIVETTEKLKDLEKQAQSSNVVLAKIGTTSQQVADKAGSISSATAPVTATIAAAGVAAVSFASDTEESLNKVKVAFGNSADKVKAFADTSLETYGIARGTALDMAATYGDMGTSMGLMEDTAADMAVSLTGLAGDLASFKNIGIDRAMTALNGVFTGETESLKTLGIVMTQTNLDAFALANGFEKTTKDMTEAEKVQLRYRYVLNATKNAQGDFMRTSDGTANSLRVAGEGAKELAANLGELVLPTVSAVLQQVISVIKFINNLDRGQKQMIVTVLAVVAAISPVAGLISGIATAVTGLTAVMGFLAANPIVLIIAGIAGIVAVLVHWWNTSETLRTNLSTWWNGLVEMFRTGKDRLVVFFTEDIPGALTLMGELAKAPVNFMIGVINGLINSVNMAISWLNSIRVDIPSWIPGIGGKTFGGFNIPEIGNIPYLANGGTVVSGSAVVGEAGPELLTVSPYGTKVIPLTAGGKTAAAGHTINFNATFYGYKHSDGVAAVKDLNRLLGSLLK